MKRFALRAIRFYQRHLSPRQGFGCAYRCHTGRAGCSGLGYRAIRRFGLWRGLLILRQRLDKCGVAYRRHFAGRGAWQAQAGFCDVGCDFPCDCDPLAAGGDLLMNLPCDCGTGWGRRRHDATPERQVHLPPPSERRRG